MKWLLFFLVLPLVVAQPTSITVLDLSYDEDGYTLQEAHEAVGYVPSRVVQPTGGDVLRIMQEGTVLYQMKFIPPTQEFVDGHEAGENLGGRIVYEAVNFSLIIPAYEQQEIFIDTKEGKTYALEKGTPFSLYLWIGALVLVLLALGIIAFERKARS